MSDEFIEDEGGENLEVSVPYTLDGMRIDRALAILTGLSRAEAQAILEDGRVQINEKVITKASFHLEDGQQLVAQLPIPDDGFVVPEPDVPVDVVFEDEQFLVINKRADQVVHPGAGRTGRPGARTRAAHGRCPAPAAPPTGSPAGGSRRRPPAWAGPPRWRPRGRCARPPKSRRTGPWARGRAGGGAGLGADGGRRRRGGP